MPLLYFKAKKNALFICSKKIDDDNDDALSQEIKWLDSVTSAMPDLIDPWSKHHSQIKRQVPDIKGIHSIVPLMDAPVHTLQTQHHCMNISSRCPMFCTNFSRIANNIFKAVAVAEESFKNVVLVTIV